jgi:hypothetical protein
MKCDSNPNGFKFCILNFSLSYGLIECSKAFTNACVIHLALMSRSSTLF